MKDNIKQSNYPQILDNHKTFSNTPELFIIDYTKKNDGKETLVQCLIEYDTDWHSLLIKNHKLLEIEFIPLPNKTFKRESGYSENNCECVIYISSSNDKHWILFIEMKYAEASERSTKKGIKKAKDQLKNTVNIFRQEKILSLDKLVFCVTSIPTNNEFPGGKFILNQVDKDEMRDNNILYYFSNTVIVESEHRLSFK